MIRCALLVDMVARRTWLAIRSASLPVPAVSTTNGLAPKSVNAPASAAEVLAWANSSTKLRRLLPVARLARASSSDCGGRVPASVGAYRRVRAKSSRGGEQGGDPPHGVVTAR